ncbi:MMPL family transporter [Dactylosporangium darangshiense]|uniref:MMPL family transporter n=1 Tax=Dactylosporangium darangshiense TaxID=579108 RepID=A0ABP8DP40_9ACTN
MYPNLLRMFLASRLRAAATVGLWLIIVGVLAAVAPKLESVEDNASANLPPAASDSMRARQLLRQAFPEQTGTPAIIVVHGRGSDRQATADAALRINDVLTGPDRPGGVAGVISAARAPQAAEGLVSADGGTQLVVANVQGSPSDASFRYTVAAVRRVADQQAGDAEVAVTGPAGIATDTTAVFSGGDRTLLLATVVLVVAILLAIYRSPLMALIPLLAVGVAMRVAQSLGALMAHAGWFDISSQTASIMTVLLFGVGTDYALIITARYREALIDEPDRFRAMQIAMRGVGETVLSSASTVVLAMFALLVSASPALRGFGPYLALGVAAMALVAFTFIPALVLLAGRAVFWPLSERRAAQRGLGGAAWHRVARLVTDAPAKVIAGVVAVLALLSLGLVNYRTSFDFVSGFRIETDSARGQALLRDGLGPGEIAPTTVLVHSSAGVTAAQSAAIAAALRAVDGVARVGGRPQLSGDGTAAAVQVVLDVDPYGSHAFDMVAPLRAAAGTAAANAGVGGAEVLVAGETAQTADIRDALDRDMGYIVVLVLAIVTVVLGLLLRSVLAPVYLAMTLVLSFVATLGATTLLTLTVLGDEGIGNRVAAYIFVFLVALGVDYNIFVMSRLKQELRVRALPEAIRAAVTRTGGVVSSAGLILAATFAVLMTQPIRELFQFGFAMAFGILLDTFLIRPLLVPAIVTTLGTKALWPARIRAIGATESPAP